MRGEEVFELEEVGVREHSCGGEGQSGEEGVEVGAGVAEGEVRDEGEVGGDEEDEFGWEVEEGEGLRCGLWRGGFEEALSSVLEDGGDGS